MYTVKLSDLLRHVSHVHLTVVVRCLVLGVEDCMKPHEPRGMEILKTDPASQEFAQIYGICVGGKGQIDALLGCHCSGHCQSVIWNPYALVQ